MSIALHMRSFVCHCRIHAGRNHCRGAVGHAYERVPLHPVPPLHVGELALVVNIRQVVQRAV
eukprot:6577932-Lingulodinium_polyedra.AAC.1